MHTEHSLRRQIADPHLPQHPPRSSRINKPGVASQAMAAMARAVLFQVSESLGTKQAECVMPAGLKGTAHLGSVLNEMDRMIDDGMVI